MSYLKLCSFKEKFNNKICNRIIIMRNKKIWVCLLVLRSKGAIPFEATLGYTMSSRPGHYSELLSQKASKTVTTFSHGECVWSDWCEDEMSVCVFMICMCMFMHVHLSDCGYAYAAKPMWKSENNHGHQSSTSTLSETGSLAVCCSVSQGCWMERDSSALFSIST